MNGGDAEKVLLRKYWKNSCGAVHTGGVGALDVCATDTALVALFPEP